MNFAATAAGASHEKDRQDRFTALGIVRQWSMTVDVVNAMPSNPNLAV